MQIAKTHSYRHAEAILDREFAREKADIEGVLKAVDFSRLPHPRQRKRNGRIVSTKFLSADKTNKKLAEIFRAKDWEIAPRIISGSESELRADAKSGKIQVEVQFGNMARWYTDVFKFLLSYSADDIEVGVLVVPMKATADKLDENIAHYERVVRELPHAKMGITIPIWVIGVSEEAKP